MTIRDLLAAESINLNGTPAGKTEALNQCIDLMAKSGKIADVEKYRKTCFSNSIRLTMRNCYTHSNSCCAFLLSCKNTLAILLHIGYFATFCKRGGRHNRNWNGYSNSSL